MGDFGTMGSQHLSLRHLINRKSALNQLKLTWLAIVSLDWNNIIPEKMHNHKSVISIVFLIYILLFIYFIYLNLLIYLINFHFTLYAIIESMLFLSTNHFTIIYFQNIDFIFVPFHSTI